MPRPFYRITADGQDISSVIRPVLVQMTITDGVGRDSDYVRIQVDDQLGSIRPPRKGAVLSVVGGYVGGEVRNFGLFTVDQVSLSGWPQAMSISARSLDALSEAKQGRDKSYPKKDYPTYGDIYSELAGRMGLGLAIAATIKSKTNEFEGQFGEADRAFASRLGDKLNAHVSVKMGRLIVVERGAGQGAGGGALPPILVTRPGNLMTYNVSTFNGPKHQKVRAIWFDRAEGKDREVTVNASAIGPEFLLRDNFQDEGDARKAAEAKAEELKRGEGSASFTIAGTPSARAEAHVIVSGVRSLVDGVWRATTVNHMFRSTSSYDTSLSCEALGSQ